MSRLGYILRCIVKMDYSNLIKTVNRSHKKSGKGRSPLFVDIVKCGFKYGAGYMDFPPDRRSKASGCKSGGGGQRSSLRRRLQRTG